jgi:hypothetical protein
MHRLILFLFIASLYACQCDSITPSIDNNEVKVLTKNKYTHVYYFSMLKTVPLKILEDSIIYLKLPHLENPQKMVLMGANISDTIVLSYTFKLCHGECSGYQYFPKTVNLESTSTPNIAVTIVKYFCLDN